MVDYTIEKIARLFCYSGLLPLCNKLFQSYFVMSRLGIEIPEYLLLLGRNCEVGDE